MIHRRVGELQQVLDPVGILWRQRDADTGRHHDLVALDRYRRLQGFEQALGYRARRRRFIDVIQDHGELVSAQSRDANARLAVDIFCQQVAFPHTAGQTTGDFAEKRVAGAVTKGVVDSLEVVQVQEQQGDFAALAPRNPQEHIELLREKLSIRQLGETVVVGKLAKLVFGLGHLLDGLGEFAVAL